MFLSGVKYVVDKSEITCYMYMHNAGSNSVHCEIMSAMFIYDNNREILLFYQRQRSNILINQPNLIAI
jgi:hypothetical protein